MFVDSHCHLDCVDLTPFNGKFDNVMTQAMNAGVEHFLCVCIELDKYEAIKAIKDSYSNVSISVGLHPNVTHVPEVTYHQLVEIANRDSCVAIGETGLDFHYIAPESKWQIERFRTHISAARHLKKPLIIHMRDASDTTIRLMRNEKADEAGGVMHCFTETWEVAKQALDLGFYISLSGIVTFKNAKSIQEVAQKLPLDRMLIETDSPYLAPVPYRGKSNQPAYVPFVAQKIAELRGCSVDTIAKATTDNFYNLFKIPKQ